jgi:hypothetical protein
MLTLQGITDRSEVYVLTVSNHNKYLFSFLTEN